ncbi:unnamed protein product [Candida verbasci]|uniref:Magnesium-dependent phosphatase-1 n=1 Tax=Candida verbasci TaxID=1227364 RepID=A0A9W4TUB4_9ASCO|nr:unnamed protein product [Candida verbasci]
MSNTNKRYPKAVVFDLDYTLWPCWCDTHIYTPIKSLNNSTIIDSNKFKLSFYKDVEKIILELIENNIIIIGASRTATPSVAKKILSLLEIGDEPAINHFDSLQWGQGTKINHIRKAAKELDIVDELKNGEFILFDDESRNKDVESINVHFAHIKDESRGLTMEIFNKELKKWHEKYK